MAGALKVKQLDNTWITVNQGPPGDPGVGVPAGGTTDQVLAKASDTDHDTEWVDQTGGGVTDGDKGDIVVSGSGATWMLDSAVVTTAAKTVLDDTTVGAMRTTLGVPAAGNGLIAVWKGTAAEYAAIGTPDANTLYAVTP